MDPTTQLITTIGSLCAVGLAVVLIEKTFTVPTSAASLFREGDIIPAWIDPMQPHNTDKIVIHVGGSSHD